MGHMPILDAASFVSTNILDLKHIQADFVCISFYKIFGYPTGLGALIIRNSALKFLKKSYFGGGTVEMHLVNKSGNIFKTGYPEEAFEDGTQHYQGILSLSSGFEIIDQFGGMEQIAKRTFYLAQYLYTKLIDLRYQNGQNVVKVYSSSDYKVII